MTLSVTLTAGPLTACWRPDLGGCLAGFWHGTTPILRSADASVLASPRQSACFPMLPYSNRLAHCQFSWLGQSLRTQPNFPGSPHSLHGVGWQRAWEVAQQRSDALSLRYQHQPDADWPFEFDACLQAQLTPQALALQLQLRNTDQCAQPVGLGFHPYFVRRAGTWIEVPVQQRWDQEPSGLPVALVPTPALTGHPDGMAYDHCFEAWSGVASVHDEALNVVLRSQASRLVVFTPQGQPQFCLEPVSHVNNAINLADSLAHGLVQLEPGQTTALTMTLEVRSNLT